MRMRRTAMLATGLLLLTGSLLVVDRAGANTAALHSQYNDRCVDADLNAINQNGAKVQLWECNGSSQQSWTHSDDGTIRVGFNGKCLDADTNTAGRNGTVVQLWDCNGSAQQRWSVINGVIRSGFNGRCLDADLNAIGSNGARVQLWDCNQQKQQGWYGIYNSAQSSSCLAYGPGQIWTTATKYARVRVQACMAWDHGILRPYSNFQVDWPTTCSAALPLGGSCGPSDLTKVKSLSFAEIHWIMRWNDPTGAGSSGTCRLGAFSATWPGVSSYTLTCWGGWMPLRFSGRYGVNLSNVEGDVKDDGQGWKGLSDYDYGRVF